MPQVYKLSPSDFKYLWEDCKYCFYQKVKLGLPPPSGAFPAIFGRLNNLLQNSVMGHNLKDIHKDLPSGIVDIQEGFLRSIPVPGAQDCFISGRFDILSKLDDGTYSVIDFKITNPDPDQIRKFSSQLHAYKFALENPANGVKPVKVSKLGLISVTPESIDHVNGKLVFTADPKWHPIKTDMDGFFGLIKEISKVLNGPVPEVSETCGFCVYRNRFKPQEKVPDDMPF